MGAARSALLALLSYLALGPLLAPLPLPYSVGGLIKVVAHLFAGPITALHCTLLCAYSSAVALGLGGRSLVIPARISALAVTSSCAMLLVVLFPTVYDLPGRLEAAFGPLPPPEAGAPRPIAPFSAARWALPPDACVSASTWPNLPNRTLQYLRYDKRGHGTPPPSPLYPLTAAMWDVGSPEHLTAHVQRPGLLEALFWPAPRAKGDALGGLLVFVHGGGHWTGNRLQGLGCYLEAAHRLGWSVASIEYRLTRHGWNGTDLLADVQLAVRALSGQARQLRFKRGRVVLVGMSAGAHLALLAAYTLPRGHVAAVAAMYPATDLERSRRSPVRRGSWDEAMWAATLCPKSGDSYFSRDSCRGLSPLSHVGNHTPPTLLLHGTADEYYPSAHSEALADALAAARVPHMLLLLPLLPHALDFGANSAAAQLWHHALDHLLLTVGTS